MKTRLLFITVILASVVFSYKGIDHYFVSADPAVGGLKQNTSDDELDANQAVSLIETWFRIWPSLNAKPKKIRNDFEDLQKFQFILFKGLSVPLLPNHEIRTLDDSIELVNASYTLTVFEPRLAKANSGWRFEKQSWMDICEFKKLEKKQMSMMTATEINAYVGLLYRRMSVVSADDELYVSEADDHFCVTVLHNLKSFSSFMWITGTPECIPIFCRMKEGHSSDITIPMRICFGITKQRK